MMGFGDGSGVSWTICKLFAPGCRPITTATVQHLTTHFYRRYAIPDAQLSVEALKAHKVVHITFLSVQWLIFAQPCTV